MSEIQGKPVFGVCACKEKVQVLSVDQVIDLIQQMATNNWQVPEDYLPKTSVNGIVEQNSKDEVKLWVGTQAQYNELTVEEQSKIFAIISDDPTLSTIETALNQYGSSIDNINSNITDIYERLEKLGFKEGTFTATSSSGSSPTFINNKNSITKIGKYAIGSFSLSYTGLSEDIITIRVPDEFKPKYGATFIAHKSNFLITGETEDEVFYGSIEPDGTITFSSDYVSWTMRLDNLGWEIE